MGTKKFVLHTEDAANIGYTIFASIIGEMSDAAETKVKLFGDERSAAEYMQETLSKLKADFEFTASLLVRGNGAFVVVSAGTNNEKLFHKFIEIFKAHGASKLK